MKTSSKMMFFMMCISSTIMVLSSSNWMNMWIGLEINLMSFIPLMFKSKNNLLAQSSIMYFLMQSLASNIFILMILMKSYMLINLYNNMLINLIIMLSMMMKMGMPPFHMWFPEIMLKMSWNMCSMLMTWQKIAPMYILSQSMENNKITMSIIILSTIIGAIMGLNQTSTQKLMAYSSINHMGWMMACAMMYKKLWLMYLVLYSLMIITMCMNLKKYNIMFINQFNTKSMTMTEKLSFMIMMLSMGGLPPFLGFLPKWITIKYMINSSEMFMLSIMMMMSLITMSYYLRMISSIIMMMSFSQKWIIMNNMMKMSTTLMLNINTMFPLFILSMNLM